MIMTPKHQIKEKEEPTEQVRMKGSASFMWLSFQHCLNTTVVFSKNGIGTKHHSGHMWLSPEEVKAKSSSLEKRELKIICDSLSLLIPKDAIWALLAKRTKMSLIANQLIAIANSMKSTVMKNGREWTPAERSMENLKGDDNITHCALASCWQIWQLLKKLTNSKNMKIIAFNFLQFLTILPI